MCMMKPKGGGNNKDRVSTLPVSFVMFCAVFPNLTPPNLKEVAITKIG